MQYFRFLKNFSSQKHAFLLFHLVIIYHTQNNILHIFAHFYHVFNISWTPSTTSQKSLNFFVCVTKL